MKAVPMLERWAREDYITPFRVGLFVLVSAACLAAFLIILKRGHLGGESMTVVAYFRDASGLGKRSRSRRRASQ